MARLDSTSGSCGTLLLLGVVNVVGGPSPTAAPQRAGPEAEAEVVQTLHSGDVPATPGSPAAVAGAEIPAQGVRRDATPAAVEVARVDGSADKTGDEAKGAGEAKAGSDSDSEANKHPDDDGRDLVPLDRAVMALDPSGTVEWEAVSLEELLSQEPELGMVPLADLSRSLRYQKLLFKWPSGDWKMGVIMKYRVNPDHGTRDVTVRFVEDDDREQALVLEDAMYVCLSDVLSLTADQIADGAHLENLTDLESCRDVSQWVVIGPLRYT